MDVYMKSTELHLDDALNHYDNFDGDKDIDRYSD